MVYFLIKFGFSCKYMYECTELRTDEIPNKILVFQEPSDIRLYTSLIGIYDYVIEEVKALDLPLLCLQNNMSFCVVKNVLESEDGVKIFTKDWVLHLVEA